MSRSFATYSSVPPSDSSSASSSITNHFYNTQGVLPPKHDYRAYDSEVLSRYKDTYVTDAPEVAIDDDLQARPLIDKLVEKNREIQELNT